MVNFRQIEEEVVNKLKDGIHVVISEAEAAEPAATAVLESAMGAAGIPPAISGPLMNALENLLKHFQNDHPVATVTVTQTAIQPELPAGEAAPFPPPPAQ